MSSLVSVKSLGPTAPIRTLGKDQELKIRALRDSDALVEAVITVASFYDANNLMLKMGADRKVAQEHALEIRKAALKLSETIYSRPSVGLGTVAAKFLGREGAEQLLAFEGQLKYFVATMEHLEELLHRLAKDGRSLAMDTNEGLATEQLYEYFESLGIEWDTHKGSLSYVCLSIILPATWPWHRITAILKRVKKTRSRQE